MEVHFDMIRIGGGQRKNMVAELILKKDATLLKQHIKYLLSKENGDRLDLTMIIPKCGLTIKIALNGNINNEIKKILITHIPKNIYRGAESMLLDNMNNQIFY